MASVPSNVIDPQGCPGIQPFELDARFVWAFLCGIDGRMDSKDVRRIRNSLSSPSAQVTFAEGLMVGTFEGARFTIEEYTKSIALMIESISNWTLEFYSTVYDPKVLDALLRTYATAPNTPERVAALNAFADIYKERHPAGSMALRSLAEVSAVLEGIAEWLRQPGAVGKVLVGLGRELGEILGDELERIRSLTGQVYEQGKELGNILGQAVMQLVLFLLGL